MATDANTALQTARKTLGEKLVERGLLKDHVDEVLDHHAGGLSVSGDGAVHVTLRGKVLTRVLELDEALSHLASAAVMYVPGEWKRGGMSEEERTAIVTAKQAAGMDYHL